MIAPVRSWAMGRDEEIAYARKHGIPVKGGTESAPYSIDDNLWGRSSEGKWIEDLSHAPDDDVFQLVTRPELAPDEAEVVDGRVRGAACRSRSTASGSALVELIERAAEIGMRHGVGIVDHIEDRIVGLKVRDIYEVPAAAILLKAHRELERLCGHDPPEPVQAAARPAVGLPRLRGAVVGAAARGHRGLRRARQPARDGHDRPQAVQGQRARRHARERRTRSTTRSSRRSPSPAGCSPSRRRRGSSRSGRCSRAWRGGVSAGRSRAMLYKLLGMVVWRGGKWFLRRRYGAAMAPPSRCSRAGSWRVLVGVALRAARQRGDSRDRADAARVPRGPAAPPRLARSGAWNRHRPLPVLDGLVVEAVEWLPSGADAGLVRVRGRWADAARREAELPALGVRRGGEARQFESLPDARFGRDPRGLARRPTSCPRR